jgi:hypothetical protein
MFKERKKIKRRCGEKLIPKLGKCFEMAATMPKAPHRFTIGIERLKAYLRRLDLVQ